MDRDADEGIGHEVEADRGDVRRLEGQGRGDLLGREGKNRLDWPVFG